MSSRPPFDLVMVVEKVDIERLISMPRAELSVADRVTLPPQSSASSWSAFFWAAEYLLEGARGGMPPEAAVPRDDFEAIVPVDGRLGEDIF
mmetsp:Transcript_70978/g.152946  ORF Transcript_70978/g.152946 Transcript_70978/m.152946 type:complete len:91 (+) Transcript_70978:2108-2380(+)